MGRLYYDSNVHLGQVISLLDGMEPDNAAPFTKSLYCGSRRAIDEAVGQLCLEDCEFEPYPVITPCSVWKELLSVLYHKFRVDGRTKDFSAAAILKKYDDSSEATKKIANSLNIPEKYMSKPGEFSFILVRVPRDVPFKPVILASSEEMEGRINYIERVKDYKRDFDRQTEVNPSVQIEKTLKFLTGDAGSHFVNSITVGDEAIQIFIYSSKVFKKVCSAMDKNGWKGINSMAFQYFTGSQFCEFSTPVQLLSRDPEFEKHRALLKDPVYNLKESIFRFFNEAVGAELSKLTKLTCIGFELKSVIEWTFGRSDCVDGLQSGQRFMGPPRVTAEDFIYNIGVQGCISRFGAEGAGPSVLSESTALDYSEIYGAFSKMDMLSMLWTPYLSVSQMYVRLDEFWNYPALNKNGVKHFMVTADIIEIQGDIDFSGLESLTLVCRLLITGKDGGVPIVKLSKNACKPLELYCDYMIGSCIFEESADTRNNQLVFGSRASSIENQESRVKAGDIFAGKFPVQVFYDDPGKDVVKKWRKTALMNGIEALLSSAYIAIYPQRALPENLVATAKESRKCVKWVDNSVGAAARDTGAGNRQELCRVYARTTMILNNCKTPDDAASALPTVPALRYTAYEKSVNALLALAETYADGVESSKLKIESINREIQKSYRETERDENIKKIAQFMIAQNEAFAAREKDLEQSHNEIIARKQELCLALEQRKIQLQSTITTYKTSLDAAGTAINSALEKLQAEEKAKLSLEFIVNVVDVIVGFVTGIYTGKSVSGATQGVEKVLKRLETISKFVDMCDKIIETSENFAEHFKRIENLKSVSLDYTINQTTSLDWEIFMHDMEAKVLPLEDYVKSNVVQYLSVLRNLTSVAQSICEVELQWANLINEIFEEESRAGVAKKQEERLKKLSLRLDNPDWKPNTDYFADLGQFQAILQQKQNNVLLKLIELLRLQDDSMSFHYLSKPTIITQLDIISVKESISSQALAALAALNRYPYKITDLKKPVTVQLRDVCTNDLQDGKSVTHQIGMTHDVFETLAHVRINSLDIRINGVSTDTGKCHVVVETLGNPMHDRGFDREVLSYKMASQEWHIVYDIKSGDTIIGTDPAREWGKYYTKPTPFQSYRISIPRTSENKGLRFEKAFTDITLSFMIEAAYSPVKVNGVSALNTAIPGFVNLLKNVSITDGWDAVSFFSIDAINALWEKRYQNEVDGYFKQERKFTQDIEAIYTRIVTKKLIQQYQFFAETSAPRLEFVKDSNNSALIEIPLMKANLNISSFLVGQLDEEKITELTCTAASGASKPYLVKVKITQRNYEDGELVSEDITESEKELDKPPLIKTKASLKKLRGQLQEAMVYIDPAFDFLLFENIGFDDEINPLICNEITKYLKEKKLQPWVLGQLKLDSSVDFLKVKTFDFHTHVPPEAKKTLWPAVLGIYILTVTLNPPEHGIRQNWSYMSTWPVSQDMNGAVYFSADLLWDKEIKPALETSLSTQVTIQKSQLSQQGNMYKLKANFTGTKTIYREVKKLRWFQRDEFSERSGDQDETAKVDFPLSEINFELNPDSLKLNTNCTWNEQFPYESKSFGPGYASQSIQWSNASFSCSFDSTAGAGINHETFEVTFGELGIVSPQITANVDTYKFFWYDMTADTKKIADKAKTELETFFKNLKVNFNKMPMFAVTNVLFPESKALIPSGVYFPLDLVIVGVVPKDL